MYDWHEMGEYIILNNRAVVPEEIGELVSSADLPVMSWDKESRRTERGSKSRAQSILLRYLRELGVDPAIFRKTGGPPSGEPPETRTVPYMTTEVDVRPGETTEQAIRRLESLWRED